MSPCDYQVEVAAMNGRPQRLVTVNRMDGCAFRDHINADSARSRRGFIRCAAGKFAVDEQELQWLDDAIVAAADEADARADAAASQGDSEIRKSQATQLVELCTNVELFRDLDVKGFARFMVGEHLEVTAVRSRYFRNWLAHLFYLTMGKAASSQAMQDAIGVLEGKAIFEGKTHAVHVRVAEGNGKIYVDLCNDAWQVVEVSASGWRVLDESPVMFRRAKAMLPLPLPVKDGSVDELRRFVHITDEDWTLFVAWLVAALRPFGPYPVLDLQGEHGSGKSTACRMARALVDPNTAMLRSEPREPRDIMIAANNGWVIALDNLSGIQAWQSDCLCRLATGGGFSTRTLYENDEETIFDAQRPVIINGIDDVATRADLLDRCLLINVPRIEQNERQPEAELWQAFETARPRIFGALLSAVSTALHNVHLTKLAALPRMADFAIWVTAAAPGLGHARGAFLAAYQANRNTGNEVALESSPVGKAVMEFIAAVCQWSGTSTDLLEQLDGRVNEKARRLNSWPTTARLLGGAMKRLAPNLRAAGVSVEFSRTGRKGRRTISLGCTQEEWGNPASASSASSAPPEMPEFAPIAADATADANWPTDADPFEPASAGVDVYPEGFGVANATDEADADFPAFSGPSTHD